jgi:hypothetical protein
MKLRVRLRDAARLALMAAVAVSAVVLLARAGRAAAAEAPRTVIKDPHYGDSLFYFYQGRYFTAVTNLMVSQHFGRMPLHADEAEVLRGGLFLSYGLHREAGEIFAQLIEKGAPPPVRDRAWFYLAKIRYQRGFTDQAFDAIGRIEGRLPPDLEEERALLHANLLMARADYAGAAKVLDRLGKSATAGRYARYNLGVALIRGGDTARGAAVLDELGKLPAASEEYLSLRDKANVALGFTALQENDPQRARSYLERVRLSGMLSNKALLGFGWAAAARKQAQAALVPWTELAQRETSDAAVLESKLAVPYAYAELGAYAQSLDLYQQAIAVFDQENVNLDESIGAIRAGRLLAGLLERNPGEEMGWFWNIRELPDMPHAGHLAQVLAQHEFQEAFKNYRDLQFLSKNLQHWNDSLGVLRDMLANRRQAFAERVPVIVAKERTLGIDTLAQRRDALKEELARVAQEAVVTAFADPKERELLERLDNVRSILAAGGNDPELAEARERFRRVAGALSWQLAQEFPGRLWEAKKSMRDVDQGLDDARRRNAALAQAQQSEPQRFEAFAARIVALEKRLRALIPRVAELSKEQQQYVQELAVAELTRQKERLAVYTTQARFAVAQLYDRANAAKDGGHASSSR